MWLFVGLVGKRAASALAAGASVLVSFAAPAIASSSITIHKGESARLTNAGSFTVTGNDPVPNQTADRSSDQGSGAPAGETCRRARHLAARAEGSFVAQAAATLGAVQAHDLMVHFLDGSGAPVNYGPASALARQAVHNTEFAELNREVRNEVTRQLEAGQRRVTLSSGFLSSKLPNFNDFRESPNLYLSFRGTQGVKVTGHGVITGGRYKGTISYKISDVYGFSDQAKFVILGRSVGQDMHYLQTVCGAPAHENGAHWFKDSVTVTVPYRQTTSR